jgi:hypothetical protein
MNCPGSIALSEGLPEPADSEASILGTCAHELVEECLTNGEDASYYLGEYVTAKNEARLVDAAMVAGVQMMLDEVRTIRDEYAADDCGTEMMVEARFDLSPLNPPGPMFGTGDVVIWVPSKKLLHVIDYKNGSGVVVEAKGNPQLRYYALGASVHLKKVPDEVIVTIVQPNADHPDGPIRSDFFLREDLIEFKRELFEAAAKTQEPGAPIRPGKWCRWCKAHAVCPAQMNLAQETAMVVFEDDAICTDEVTPLTTLTLEDISNVLQHAPVVMDWLRKVEAHALELAEKGTDIPGYKLVTGRSNRRWTDPEAASKYLQRKGYRLAERTTQKLVSPKQAEVLLKSKGHDLGYISKFWEKPEGKAKLAPDQDSRPALPPAADRAFADIDTL